MNVNNMNLEPTKAAKARGLRLIDLLAVLGIVGVASAIMFPVFTGNHNEPRFVCMSNLKQTALATLMYVTDNDDNLPIYYTFEGTASVDKFIEATFPYTKNKQIFLCPGDKPSEKDPKPAPIYAEGVPDKMSYVHCLSLRGLIPEYNLGKRMLTVSALADTSKVAYLRDPIRGFGTSNMKGGESKSSSPSFLSAHGAHFSVSYLDGHVRSKNPVSESSEL